MNVLRASGLIVLLMLLSCSSQEKSGIMEETSNDSLKKVTIIDDIPYRPGDSESWRLDLALPEPSGDGKRPAIVIVHGGGWRFGSKQDPIYRALLLNYALKGYVTASVDYRLHQEAPFPACVEDVKCAVRWLWAHAGKYNVDPERIGAYGHSAGGHLVLMLAMCPPEAGLEGDGGWEEYSSQVNAVIGGSAPTVWGERLQDWAKPEWWPIGYIKKDLPPMLLIQGVKDPVVKVELVDDFVEKMKTAGAEVEYLRIEEGDHGVAYLGNLDQTDPAMETFFEKTLRISLPQQ